VETAAAIQQVREQFAAFEERFQDWQFSYEVYQSDLARFYQQRTQFEERIQAWQHSYQTYQDLLAALHQRQARIKERRRRSQEHQQSKPEPKQEIAAHLVQGNGQVIAMPTTDLLVALDQVRLSARTQRTCVVSNTEAVSLFLQTLKNVMQTCKTLPPEP
jgi:hypothetical protein